MRFEAADRSPPPAEADLRRPVEPAPATRRVAAADDPVPAAAPSAAGGDAASVRPTSRWMGWRLRLLVAYALLGSVGLFAFVDEITNVPSLDAVWEADPHGSIRLAATHDRVLESYVGYALTAVLGGGQSVPADEALVSPQLPRWIVDDRQRERRLATLTRLRGALESADPHLVFDDGSTVAVRPTVRSLAGLPLVFWLFLGFGFALYLVAMVVLLADPRARNILYSAKCLCQSANLFLVATSLALPLGPTPDFVRDATVLAFVLDWITAAGMVSAACVHPRRLPYAGAILTAAWAVVAGLSFFAATGQRAGTWWWAQSSIMVFGAATIALFSWSYRLRPHPFAIGMRRLGLMMLSGWVVLTLVLDRLHAVGDLGRFATNAPLVWYLFFAALLLPVPFLARSQRFMREFALLAAISTGATMLDLVFVAVFSIGQFTSLALALFASLAVYTGVRQWILNRLLGTHLQTTEHMFEQLYRTAREVEAHGERLPALLGRLLSELFEPLETAVVECESACAGLVGGGSSLRVPVPLFNVDHGPRRTIALRYAGRGRRLFTAADARLADRIVEQLRRAVDYDKAVERGRGEERQRLAQDLHDDIGARLLTLMYTATSPQTEDYVRNTLQDLKTLTRGLAESNHRLSHAAAEWKSDIAHRLEAAGIDLGWRVRFDVDVLLTVVQWSALTRILRELVTNVIAHSEARHVEVDFRLDTDSLALVVGDDGRGRDPEQWAHGLGLGGIRKRVLQLGGKVEWYECVPRGMACRVTVESFSTV